MVAEAVAATAAVDSATAHRLHPRPLQTLFLQPRARHREAEELFVLAAGVATPQASKRRREVQPRRRPSFPSDAP